MPKTFSPELRARVAKRANMPDAIIAKIAREEKVGIGTVRKWRDAMRPSSNRNGYHPPPAIDLKFEAAAITDHNFRRLEEENRRLTRENTLLREAIGFVAKLAGVE